MYLNVFELTLRNRYNKVNERYTNNEGYSR